MAKLNFKNLDKKKKTLLIILSCILVVAITIGIAIPVSISNQNKYHQAHNYLAEYNYAEAMKLFKKLGGYKDSKNKYVMASSMHSGDYKGYINLYSLKEFEVPSGVTVINEKAFENCASLTSVTIPNSVSSIGSYAFYGCDSLKKVNYLGTASEWVQIDFSNATSNPLYFAKNLYNDGVLLEKAEIKTCTKISKYAFYNCSLTSVEISNSVKNIEQDAFALCKSLEKVNYLGSISDWLNINFANYLSNPTVSAKDLYLNGELLTNLKINSVEKISNYAFSGCKSITSLEVGDSVKEIGNSAFSDCADLSNVTLSNGLTTIFEEAFLGCASLTEIKVPSSVNKIGFKCFYQCSSLASITLPFIGELKDGTGKTHFSYIFGNTNNSYNNNFVPSTLKSVIISSGATAIGELAFNECTSIASIFIPSSVTTIGEDAFFKCKSLTILCEVESKPDGWSSFWNSSNRPVIWEYTEEEI